MSTVSLKELCDTLEKVGIRPTHQRLEILKYLAEHRVHPTAEMIYSSLKTEIPTFSKTTVYNTLKLLEKKGVISALATVEDQIRYEANLTPHGHFKCIQCGRLFDFELTGVLPPRTEIDGHQVLECQVMVKGICRQCRSVTAK
ncbi:MAG: transcriptional repressor [Firmicutes bacterium]|nr:transcriptional repressor [Bacillota bacterium]